MCDRSFFGGHGAASHGAAGHGAAASASGREPMDTDNNTSKGQGQSSADDLMTRVRSYLSRRASSASTTSGTSSTTVNVSLSENIPPKGVASTYSAILKNKLISLCVPNLKSVEKSLAAELGSFFNKDDSRMSSSHYRSNYAKNWNVSFSFHPGTFSCTACGVSPHQVANVSVGGEDCQSRVFVLADQSFPPILPDVEGSGCISIIRIENGNLQELASIFLETFMCKSWGGELSLTLIGNAPGSCWVLGLC